MIRILLIGITLGTLVRPICRIIKDVIDLNKIERVSDECLASINSKVPTV